MKRLMLAVLLAFLAVTAWATSVKCNIDNGALHQTGKTKVESGVMLYEHQCPSGHSFWLTAAQL
jgi:hypothetical protein